MVDLIIQVLLGIGVLSLAMTAVFILFLIVYFTD